MAIDKMVDSAKLDREMLTTANAIREKGKTEAAIPWEDEIGFEQAILAIKGGVDLNFEVVGGETEPTNPTENTIWVNTPNEITGWGFSPDEPTAPESGMVWFATSENSVIKFNALKEDSIIVTPSNARQYISGSWSNINVVKIYQNGEWVDWWDGTLYNAGDMYTNITGGWEMGYPFTNYQNGGTGSFQPGYITLTNVSMSSYGIYTKKSIDLTNHSALHVKASGGNIRITVNDVMPCRLEDAERTSGLVAKDDTILDLNGLSGMKQIAVCAELTTPSLIYKIWLS